MERYIVLWINEINCDIEKDGLTENVIRREIEEVLSREGIKLLSKNESSANPNWQIQGEPSLKIYPRTIKNVENRYVFRISFEFEQIARPSQFISLIQSTIYLSIICSLF